MAKTSITPKKESVKAVPVDKATIENEKLKNELKEMKKMIEALSKVEKKESYINNINGIDPKYRVKITSLYHGGLNLRGLNKDIRFEKFGQQRSVYFEDVEAFYSNNLSFLEKGFLFIHDEKVIQFLYLEKEYEKIIPIDTLKNIFKLESEDIKDLYDSTTETLQNTIVDTFAKWISENDPTYLDKNRIEAINKISGRDVVKIAEAIKAYNKE
jgi:hypothetical protein